MTEPIPVTAHLAATKSLAGFLFPSMTSDAQVHYSEKALRVLEAVTAAGFSIVEASELEARRAERDYTNEVLRVFAQADSHEDLLWQVGENGPRFAVICNDVFYWATADAETIERDDLPLLYQAAADAREADEPYFTGVLFAARKRGMRPQSPFGRTYNKEKRCYEGDNLTPMMRAFIDACGPVRTKASEG